MLRKLGMWWRNQYTPVLPPTPSGLIAVLLDQQADYGARHDAAMALAQYRGPEVEQALTQTASDRLTDPDLAAECGETLALLWLWEERFDSTVLTHLQPSAFACVARVLSGVDREWDDTIFHIRRERGLFADGNGQDVRANDQ